MGILIPHNGEIKNCRHTQEHCGEQKEKKNFFKIELHRGSTSELKIQKLGIADKGCEENNQQYQQEINSPAKEGGHF